MRWSQHGFDVYTRKLVVQYYDRVYVNLDEIVTMICAVEKNNPVNVMKSVFTAPLEDGWVAALSLTTDILLLLSGTTDYDSYFLNYNHTYSLHYIQDSFIYIFATRPDRDTLWD